MGQKNILTITFVDMGQFYHYVIVDLRNEQRKKWKLKLPHPLRLFPQYLEKIDSHVTLQRFVAKFLIPNRCRAVSVTSGNVFSLSVLTSIFPVDLG